MSKIDDKLVADVVAEASRKMSDPNYSAVAVGGFVQGQTPATQFITAHESELGNAEGIVSVIFHAALVAQCFERGGWMISYEDLDAVATGDPLKMLAGKQPALSDFIVSNVEHKEAQKLLALLALAMDYIT